MAKKSLPESAEFQAFRRRCRYDIFIQRRIQCVQDEAVVNLADDYGFTITIADLRRQRRVAKRKVLTNSRRGKYSPAPLARIWRWVVRLVPIRWGHPT